MDTRNRLSETARRLDREVERAHQQMHDEAWALESEQVEAEEAPE